MVRKSSIPRSSTDCKLHVNSVDVHEDVDLDADMVVGDFEPEIGPTVGSKVRPPQGSMKSDAEELVNGINMSPPHPISLSIWIDPFCRLLHPPPSKESSPSGSGLSGDAEKLFRETSIRRNRRQKFIDCLSKDNVDIGMRCSLVAEVCAIHTCSRAAKASMGRYTQ